MSQQTRNPSSSILSREPVQPGEQPDTALPIATAATSAPVGSPELVRALAEVKGQAQFLLYLADQIEDSLQQLGEEAEVDQNAFLCKIIGMYAAQLESKHQGLGDKISETCQELYVTVREFDLA